ncbi:betaine-aldehyde dehydrogenase [Aurantimonas endophytica]|uniref:Betaine aldehyde dehydrogenase n=1 Tax=Aurantimonas endophytica TaxID=1522175 RepID=A0A7W6MRU6_9HYPH|nr:betaine-aldehyde dehydrogenase [Aurantimonas endophytica]MBB4005420.1 betaine-aldehyde dehydrogenase [Aurantimonas endophytica]MCO6405923.1 betaine-aldehyde dehydrogenase [Aurantimonas endophytica]
MRAQPPASHYVDGLYVEDEAGESFDSVYPATGEVIARLHAATPALIEQAVAAAERGQAVWAAMTGAERGRILRRAAAIMRDRNQALAELETLDTGKALAETLVADAASGADALEYFGALAADLRGDYIDLGGSFAYTRHEPLGVCAGIGAWNYPIQIASWKAAPALACGNAMIFKPSETTPLTALKLAEIFSEAGLPAGVFNVVQGLGPVGATLASHPRIAKVSVTGSVPTGARVMQAASATTKHVTLELGGKSPILVFADADLDAAVSGAILGNFYSTGQICSNGTRVFVERSVRAAFVERLVERTRAIALGDPMKLTTDLGPLVSKAQYDKVLSYLDIGRGEGATVACGGGTATVEGFAEGWFVEPTVFTDVTDGMRIAGEEIFGPVMCVLDFDDEAEAIARANASEFGLAAGVYTRDLQRGHRVVAKLQAGTCWINAYNLTPVEMPFGGVKRSGIGRENGREALAHYSQVKSVYVEMGTSEAPY